MNQLSSPSTGAQSQGKQVPSQAEQRARERAEWISFAVSASLLLTLVGLILYQWIAIPPSPPVLTAVQSGEIRRVDGQFYVPFSLINSGNTTAEAVQVIGELRIDGETVGQVEQQFDFLSGGEAAHGIFVFQHNPAAGELRVVVASYKQP